MTLRERVQRTLRELGESIELADLSLDQTGTARLVFDDRVPVDVSVDDEQRRVVLVSDLGRPPEIDEAGLHEAMLRANALQAMAEGATLALDAGSGAAVLLREVRQDCLGLRRFEPVLLAHVALAERWMRAAEARDPALAVEETPPGEDDGAAGGEPRDAGAERGASARARFRELVAEVGRGIGLHGLALDGDDRCAIAFGDGLELELAFEPTGGELALASRLGPLPAGEDRAAAVVALLDANLFWVRTGGGTLGLDDEDAVILYRAIPVDDGLDADGLHAAFESFANAAAHWRGLLATPVGSAPEPILRPDMFA